MNLGLGLGYHARSGASAPPPSPFSPSDIADLFAWYDASDTASITSSAGAVSQWADKSANAYHITQSVGARQPTTGTRTMNALNVIDFDGATDIMMLPAGTYGISNGNNTVFAVFLLDTLKDQRLINGNSFGIAPVSATLNVYNSNPVVNVPAGTVSAVSVYIGGFAKSASSLLPFLNGVAATAGTAGNVVQSTFSLGALTNNNRVLDGVVAEIIFYQRALSTAEKNTVGNYLAVKWGGIWAGL